jgi:hypothetical protein
MGYHINAMRHKYKAAVNFTSRRKAKFPALRVMAGAIRHGLLVCTFSRFSLLFCMQQQQQDEIIRE